MARKPTGEIYRHTILMGAAAAAAMVLALAPRSPAAAAECENPEALRFSIIPTEETIQELTLYKPVIDELAKRTGKKIEFYMPTSYASVIEAMLGGWVDIGVHGPYSYVIAHEQDPSIEAEGESLSRDIDRAELIGSAGVGNVDDHEPVGGIGQVGGTAG